MLPPDRYLVHFSDRPLVRAYSVQQSSPSDKPCGLWVSVEGGSDGWSDWCLIESFYLNCLMLAHAVQLRDDANILMVKSESELDSFTEAFIVDGMAWHRGINWGDVAARYSGIIISPYLWKRRLTDHTFWYYGWDCASGCIWDAGAIASISLIERPPHLMQLEQSQCAAT